MVVDVQWICWYCTPQHACPITAAGARVGLLRMDTKLWQLYLIFAMSFLQIMSPRTGVFFFLFPRLIYRPSPESYTHETLVQTGRNDAHAKSVG